ncbi:hypothetical protein [Legionella sp. WA2024007413]
MSGNKKKQVNQNIKITPTKKPSRLNLSNDDTGQVVWSFALADNDGAWSFKKLNDTQLHDLIFNELVLKEHLSWNDLQSAKSHHVESYKLIKEAQDRLRSLNMDDVNELFSLRLNGLKRIWGIRQENVLRVIWWDPKHEICPSQKKHT